VKPHDNEHSGGHRRIYAGPPWWAARAYGSRAARLTASTERRTSSASVDQLLTGRVSQTAICRAAHRRDGICTISPAAKVAIT
jgi:hypothetical protein